MTGPFGRHDRDRPLRVVLFSGGRGSRALSEALATRESLTLTVAINGYDDGASTGEVRRFLADALGPSDFRKNAATLARALSSAPAPLVDLLDIRLPKNCTTERARGLLDRVGGPALSSSNTEADAIAAKSREIPDATRSYLTAALERFEAERIRSERPFEYADCAIGNLVFAGLYLQNERRFNQTVDAYSALLGVPRGMVLNVTDGRNAHLVALDTSHRLLTTEAAIVDARAQNRVAELFLLPRPIEAADLARLSALGGPEIAPWLHARSCDVELNPDLADALADADLIVYAPGTQHSSLFPSYLTRGLAEAVAANLRAVKLMVTNLQPDAEIAGSSAVDLVERALYYFSRRGEVHVPRPYLVTHCVINVPFATPSVERYVPPGPLDRLEDPRLIWMSNFEAGSTGRHDAPKVLAPFLESLAGRRASPRVAIGLVNTTSADKVVQTVLELLRANVEDLGVEIVVHHAPDVTLDPSFLGTVPFPVCGWPQGGLLQAARTWGADYVALFDSSGMYYGADLVALLAQTLIGSPGAVWGSRRLSVRDVHESYRLRYSKTPVLGAVSYVGSHLLSLAYLAGYSRYVSDTLSGVRLVARRYADAAGVSETDPLVNHAWLASVLSDRAELRELPVRFVSLPPDRVHRTRVADGLGGLWAVVRNRVRSRRTGPGLPRARVAASEERNLRVPEGEAESLEPFKPRETTRIVR